MKYTGFINSDNSILEVYLNTNGDLCLCIKYNETDEEYPIKIENEDITLLIQAIKELKDYIEKSKSDN